MGLWLARLLRVGLTLCGLGLVLLALYVSLGRELTPLVAEYQTDLEVRGQAALGMPLRIARLEGRWKGFAPILVAHDVSLGEADSSLRLDQVRVIPDVLGSLLSMQLKIADLQIEGLQVHLQQGEDGQWAAQGLPVRADAEPLAPAVILASLQRIGWLSLLNSQVIVQAHGQAPVALTYVNFSLRSQGSRQRLDGRLVLPDGQPLALRLSSRLHPKVWREAELALYLNLPQSDWARWVPAQLTQQWRLERLQAGGQFWLDWSKGSVQRAALQLHAPKVLGGYAKRPAVSLQDLGLNAHYLRTDTGFQLQLDSLAATLGDTRWGDARLGLEYQAEDAEHQPQWKVRADRLQLTPLVPVVKALAPLPDNLVTLLDGLQPQGAVRNLQLDYRPKALADQRLQFSANLDQVAISPFHGAPGASNVSGSISGDLGQGQLRLAADNFALELAPLFGKPWQYRRANALLQWRISPQDVTISSPLIQLDAEEGQLAGDLMIRLALDPQVEDYMDLRVGIRDGDARYTAKYLPGALSPALREWLSTAIVSGKINQGYFQYQGSLAKDAAPTASTLSLFFQVQDVELAYQPGWPALRGGDAQVFVDDQGVRVQLAKGKVLDSEVRNVSVNIPPAKNGGAVRLALDGELQSSVADGLKILREAPLGVEQTFAGWQGEGALSGRLKLDIPLAAGQTPVVQVDFATEQARLQISEPALQLNNIKGAFRFNSATGLSAPDVRAQVFGRPVRAKIVAEGKRGKARTRIEASGQVALKSVTDWLAVSQALPASGELPYRLALTLDGADSQLRIESTLKGLALDLPAPFGKTATEARYIDWRMTLQGQERRYWLAYEDLASLALAAPPGAWSAGRGQLLLGKGQATLPSSPGLNISGNLTELDYDVWQATAKRYMPAQSPVGSDFIRRVALKVGRFQGFGLTLERLDAQLTRGQAAWQVQLDSDLLTGQIRLPDAAGAPLVANLTRLQLPASKPADPAAPPAPDALASVDPRQIPAVDLSIAQVLQGDSPLGAMSLKARPTAAGVSFSDLSIDLKGLLVTGGLTWEGAVGATRSSYSGRLKGKDLAAVLTAWQFAPSATSKSFRVDVKGNWPGSPLNFNMAHLTGQVDIRLNNGQFLEVKGGSAATLRIFGLLNMNSLARRLRLDFTDLTDKGLAYDKVQGVLQGADGQFTTLVPLTLKGPSTIVVDGQLNMRQQTIDTRIRVTLPVASNLPLAALMIGAPAVGGAWFVADKLLGGKISSLTSVEYRAVGPLADPTVTFVKPF